MKDWKKLRGERLYHYLTEEAKDRDYASVVALLPQATCWDDEKAYAILERVVDEGKELVAVYPMLGEEEAPDMEYIGGILDGGLYIQ
ncbi:MAG: hypothetical protein LUC22_03915 [Prevotella sp.]|nr:hypothetical protein [Prevotella sp.]